MAGTVERPVRHGMLTKRSISKSKTTFNAKFQDRWFVLTDKTLTYHTPNGHTVSRTCVAFQLPFMFLFEVAIFFVFMEFSKKTWYVVKDVGSPTVDNANLNIVTSGKGAYQCWLYQMLWASGRKNVQQTPLVSGKV